MNVHVARGMAGRCILALRLTLAVLLLFGVVLLSAVPALAADTTLLCTEDTFISDAEPDYPGDAFGYTGVGIAYGDTYRTLLKFDIASVAGRITGAKLRVYYYDGLGTPAGNVQVLRLKRAWSETQATWNDAAAGNPWSTPGAMGADDVAPELLGQAPAPATVGSWIEVPLDPAQVERVRHGAYPDAGFLLRGDWEADPSNQTHLYRGRIHVGAPELVITHDDAPPPPVVSSPASSTWSLALGAALGVGGISAVRRRSRSVA